jgi:hypothetical protein
VEKAAKAFFRPRMFHVERSIFEHELSNAGKQTATVFHRVALMRIEIIPNSLNHVNK